MPLGPIFFLKEKEQKEKCGKRKGISRGKVTQVMDKIPIDNVSTNRFHQEQ